MQIQVHSPSLCHVSDANFDAHKCLSSLNGPVGYIVSVCVEKKTKQKLFLPAGRVVQHVDETGGL